MRAADRELEYSILLDFKKVSVRSVGIREIKPVQGFTKQFFETAFDKMNDSFEKPIF